MSEDGLEHQPGNMERRSGCTPNGLMFLLLLLVVGALVAWALLRSPDGPPPTHVGPTPTTLPAGNSTQP